MQNAVAILPSHEIVHLQPLGRRQPGLRVVDRGVSGKPGIR
jgi:hypothetical protein